MRALSFRQPFAWLTVQGIKPIENRTWATNYRGWFLVHASQQYGIKDTLLARELLERHEYGTPGASPLLRALRQGLSLGGEWGQTGGIVGAARLSGVLPRILPGYTTDLPDWRLEAQYGFELDAVHLLPFVPCSGAHKFWQPKTAEIRTRIREVSPAWLVLELETAARAFSKVAA